MNYKVTITETLKKDVEVEADSYDEAVQSVTDEWKNGDHILDADNFVDVDFDAEELKPERIKVVLLEPDKYAKVAEIGTSLEELQAVVDGFIEPFYPFDEEVCIVCNDEGKIAGMPLNRGVYDKDKNLLDIIAGTAFICSCRDENFGSLTDEQIKKYMSKTFRFVLAFSMKMEESTEELMCSKAVGGIFCLWFIFDVLYFVISFKKGITYLIFFAMHFIFTVLAASSYWSESEDRDVATPAGVLGCLSGAVAFYIALGMLLNNIYKITVIPIGLWKNEREDTKIE